MSRRTSTIFLLILSVTILLPMVSLVAPVNAAPSTAPSGPNRYKAIDVEIIQYEWWVARWKNDAIKCGLFVEHEGLPYANEFDSACHDLIWIKDEDGNIVMSPDWTASLKPCKEIEPRKCPGYYFVNTGEKSRTEKVAVKLPPPQVNVSLSDCEMDADGWCATEPKLKIKAVETLPNERITSIEGYAGGDKFICDGDKCSFTLDRTSKEGVFLEFWANSSNGDTSEVYTALVRVLKDDEYNRLIPRWRVDVFSTQWIGEKYLSCADTWQTFKPESDLPEWLSTPKESKGLSSNIPFAYLAENLIHQGIVDVSECENNGLNADGSINGCGTKAAKPTVLEWQNRFDGLIFSVSNQKDVPGQLLKNLFSRESQFWPGVFRNNSDIGLGQMTTGGADTALLWNPIFYNQFCPLVLDKTICGSTGYALLDEKEQILLQNSLVNSVDARCADCPLGLDLSRADFSVGVFARTLLANCEQAGKVVENVTHEKPGVYLDYETMWKLTLVNYNAGAGCLFNAVDSAFDPYADDPLSWASIADELDYYCPGAVGYVNDISADR